MAGSKPAALPLGDTPSGTVSSLHRDRKYGWGTRIRTWGWRDQNPLPYRLAIPHQGLYPVSIETENMAGVPGFEPGDGGIKTRCLTAWRYPIRDCIQSPSRQKIWLGYQDSNLGMAGSKPAALPLGDTPSGTVSSLHRDRKYGWGTRIRTWGWRDQNPLPYRLAIPHPTQAGLKWCGRRDLNSYTLRRQNLNLVRLPISPLPPTCVIKSGGYDGIRTCDPIIMSDVL